MNFYFYGKAFTHKQLHEANNGFLSVAGLVYGLMGAQLFAAAHNRGTEIRNVLATEISSLHIASLNLRAMPDTHTEQRTKMLRLLLCYVHSIMRGIQSSVSASVGLHEDLEGLYSISTVMEAMQETAPMQRDTILARVEAIAGARYARCFHEQGAFSPSVWLYIVSLASMMFWGVSMIQSGSDRLDFVFCVIAVFSIGYSLKMLVDADDPFQAEADACQGVLVALEDALASSVEPGNEAGQLQAPETWQKAVKKVQLLNNFRGRDRPRHSSHVESLAGRLQSVSVLDNVSWYNTARKLTGTPCDHHMMNVAENPLTEGGDVAQSPPQSPASTHNQTLVKPY